MVCLGKATRTGIALALFGALLSGCGPGAAPSSDQQNQDVPAPAPLGSIAGSVQVGDQPSEGARVVAQLDPGIPMGASATEYSALTGSDGAFRMDGLPAGLYVVTATVGELAGVRSGIEVAARAATTVTIAITPTGSLRGTVTTGAASGDAGIAVWLAGTSFVAMTSQDGSYSLTGVPIGTYTVMATMPGYTVGTQANQLVGASATTQVLPMVLVDTSNLLPQIATISCNPTQVQPGGVVAIQVKAADPDGDPLTYAWSASGGSISGSGAIVSWTAPQTAGTQTVNVLVSDGKGGSVAGAIGVLVGTSNRPPTVSAVSPATTPDYAPGSTVPISITASDPDGDTLAYLWSATGGSVSGSGASITWKAPNEPGTYTVFCTVSDGRGGLGQASASITVSGSRVTIW